MNSPVQMIMDDALGGLKSLEARTVQVCATSPPFYLLRSYGTTSRWPDGWEGELGHEEHPNDFIRHLLFVFDEVWRVLKDDGCLWVNLADTWVRPRINVSSLTIFSYLKQQPGTHNGRSCSRTVTNAPSYTSGTVRSTPPPHRPRSTSSPSHRAAA
jgi:DNA modification methylase